MTYTADKARAAVDLYKRGGERIDGYVSTILDRIRKRAEAGELTLRDPWSGLGLNEREKGFVRSRLIDLGYAWFDHNANHDDRFDTPYTEVRW